MNGLLRRATDFEDAQQQQQQRLDLRSMFATFAEADKQLEDWQIGRDVGDVVQDRRERL